MATVAGWLPLPVALWVGRRLGDLAWILLGRRRRLALDNLAIAFPDAPVSTRSRIGRRAARHLGMTLLELASLHVRPLEATLARIDLEGVEHLRDAMSRCGRALLLTAHLGNWELLAAAHVLTGYRLSVVMRPLDARSLDAVAAEIRRRAGVELIPKRGALRGVLAALQRGRMVGVLLDQNATRREGVFVDFFGRPASTSRSLALLALRTDSPIVPVFARRESGGRHRIVFRPMLPTPRDTRTEAAVVALTADCTAEIERAVRESPEQWLWWHARWRTRPSVERRS